MPQTITPTATERLARAALELHRLALTASEIRHLPSPATPREKNSKGAADPTAGTALDDRREYVAETLTRIMERVTNDYVENIATDAETLRYALDQWDGK